MVVQGVMMKLVMMMQTRFSHLRGQGCNPRTLGRRQPDRQPDMYVKVGDRDGGE